MLDSAFQQRQQHFQGLEQQAQQRYNQLAFWRVGCFVAGGLFTTLLLRADAPGMALAVFLISLLVFLWLLKKHQRVRRERDLNHYLAFINQDEAARLNRQYLRPDTGESFSNPLHPYTGDLDIFGRHSLFRLLNRTHTHKGRYRLAAWLQEAATPETIWLRQQAVAQLVPQVDWRQQFEALAYVETSIDHSPQPLIDWATTEQSAPMPAYLNVVRFVFPAVTFGLLVAWLLGYVPGATVLLALAVHGLLLSQIAGRAKETSEQTVAISAALGAFRALCKQAGQVSGDAARLRDIRQALTADNGPAADAIDQLARLTEGLNFRRNPYFALFIGVATLWDIHYLFRLERWRRQYGADLVRWFDALGELEALNSLAGFAYAHPHYVVPDIVEEERMLQMRLASHPLLPPSRSVANSLSLVGAGQTVLITGSNMSGKSTFLRTIGSNVVLALAGAVVSAEQFVCSPVQVFTSMRTQDSLEESTSSFYAELKRLQALIQLTKQDRQLPILYFLDEILKGTNSADRHRGAEALIRQLHQTSASGFVSTHDIELGQLTNTQSFVQNYHFRSELNQGVLRFDYVLRPGICTSFNASQLMQAIGIAIEKV